MNPTMKLRYMISSFICACKLVSLLAFYGLLLIAAWYYAAIRYEVLGE